MNIQEAINQVNTLTNIGLEEDIIAIQMALNKKRAFFAYVKADLSDAEVLLTQEQAQSLLQAFTKNAFITK